MAIPEKTKLNPLQTRTLALLQELASDPGSCRRQRPMAESLLPICPMPMVTMCMWAVRRVSARDASGLANGAVWQVLERRGLIGKGMDFPHRLILTPSGQAYVTGLADKLSGPSDH